MTNWNENNIELSIYHILVFTWVKKNLKLAIDMFNKIGQCYSHSSKSFLHSNEEQRLYVRKIVP